MDSLQLPSLPFFVVRKVLEALERKCGRFTPVDSVLDCANESFRHDVFEDGWVWWGDESFEIGAVDCCNIEDGWVWWKEEEPVGHECMSLNDDERSTAFHDTSDFVSELAFAGVDDCLELLLEHEVIPGFCTVQEALASSRASTQWVLCLMAQSNLTLGDESTEDESDPEDKEGNW